MKYSMAAEISEMYPGYVRGVVVATGLANGVAEQPDLLKLLQEAEALVREDPGLEAVAEHPRIASWRDAYARFGARPSKFFSSIESLVRRVRKGGQLPYINDLAVIGNVLSLRHIVPVGGHDIGVAKHDLRLAVANGSESFYPIGSDVVEFPEPGEVVYLDGDSVLCRRWTWRQAEFTKLTPDSQYVAINVDGMPPVGLDEVAGICEELAVMVTRFCGGRAQCRYLSEMSPEIDLAL